MTHDDLVLRACRWLRSKQRCQPVYAEFTHRCLDEKPDAIGWTPMGVIHVVEAKVSRRDFLADAKKTHRPRGSSMGHRRWYVAPRGLLDTWAELDGEGLLVPSGRGLRVVKPAVSRTMDAAGRQEAFSIIRNGIVRHEAGVTWYPDTFRFQTIAAQKAEDA